MGVPEQARGSRALGGGSGGEYRSVDRPRNSHSWGLRTPPFVEETEAGVGSGLVEGVAPKGRNIFYGGDGLEWLNVWMAPAVMLRSNSGVPDGAGAEHRPGNLIPVTGGPMTLRDLF